MNLKEIFTISQVFSFKIEKHHKMNPTYERACNFLRSILCDFAIIYVEIHQILENQVDLHPFKYPTMITKGIQEMNCGATNCPDLVIIFRTTKDTEKNFLHAKSVSKMQQETARRHPQSH